MQVHARFLLAFPILGGLSGAAAAASLAVTVTDAAGKPLADAVVWAEPNGTLPKVLKPAEIEQKGLKFLPMVTVIQTGSRITFPNNDKVRHHIYSFSPAHKFDQKLYSGTAAAPQVFEKAGTVVLGCNIHDTMLAYVKVVDTPFFAKTDARGVAQIDVPVAGQYALHAWHYQMGASTSADQLQQVQVKPGDAPTAAAFALTLKPAAPAAESSDF
ncbi:methylamine utilization protein [Massilia arenosa]|uniref:Methylamine utilization protein n=1 Tax=Zemynaea arenosa TaxID=2561931 RepID=A0A4Y9SSP1_9BURK|nr:methylamine utilization protein [Massilia arenosa]TFW29812.1 methylamine utilization protein [Massilia arenosa]